MSVERRSGGVTSVAKVPHEGGYDTGILPALAPILAANARFMVFCAKALLHLNSQWFKKG